MQLTPTERDRLLLFTAAELARSRRARGLRLNVPEATAIVADAVCEAARDGSRHEEAIAIASTILGPDDVLPGVADVLNDVKVEAVFDDGTRLVVVPDPIGGGSLGADAPGAVTVAAPAERDEAADAARRAQLDLVEVEVDNTAPVPITVTSHFHFFEANPRLRFDRAAAYGRHLDIAAGSTIPFVPGETQRVALVPIRGDRVAIGFAGLVDGPLDAAGAQQRALDFCAPRASETRVPPPTSTPIWRSGGCARISPPTRRRSRDPQPPGAASTHGPRAGDRVRLGDTGLVVRVESDAQHRRRRVPRRLRQDRPRRHCTSRPPPSAETCDVVISNVLVHRRRPRHPQGVASASATAGSRAIGRAGNPDTLDGVDVVVGTGTSIVSGEGLIATAGAVDTHVHLLSPRIMEASLASGVTTIIGQEFGPVWGVGRQLALGAAARLQRLRRLAGQHRLPRPRFVLRPRPAGRGARRGRRVRLQGARGHGRAHRAPSTPR